MRRIRPTVAFGVAAAVLLAGAALPAFAADGPRDRPAESSPPTTVYVGERLDLSGIGLTGGGTLGADDAYLLGENDTVVRIERPLDADLGGVPPGEYDAAEDGDDRPDIVVEEPRITAVTVENRSGADVAGRTVADLDRIVVTATYDFEVADRLEVGVLAPDGEPLRPDGPNRITDSGERVTFPVPGRLDGRYHVVVEASALGVSRTATVTVGDPPTTRTATATPATVTPTPNPTTTVTATPSPTATPTASSRPTTDPNASVTPVPSDGPGTSPSAPNSSVGTISSAPGFTAALALLSVVVVLLHAAWRSRR